MFRFKGGKSIKDVQREQKKEQKQQEEENVWAMVVARDTLVRDGWGHNGSNWYSPDRAIGGGCHLHLTTRGTRANFLIMDDLFYTHAQNAQMGGGMNQQIALDFDWVGDANIEHGRIVVRLQNANQMNAIHANQRPHLQVLLDGAWVLQLELLTL